MQGFEYPAEPHLRRHGPGGYKDYEKYRDWLRDEFMFRCVYCLHREQWNVGGPTFHIDHFIPVAEHPSGKLEYSNLLYACSTCNTAKCNTLGVPDPCSVPYGDIVRVREDGHVVVINKSHAGKSLVDKLKLNKKEVVVLRHRWIRTLKALQLQYPDLYREYMAFPDGLPDLRPSTMKVPQNSRPESVNDCFFAMRERGELPASY